MGREAKSRYWFSQNALCFDEIKTALYFFVLSHTDPQNWHPLLRSMF
jgi:hypothetical protein